MTQIFRHSHRVSYSECTLGNHVYYARYLDILEMARGEFFRALGQPLLSLQQQDTIFPVLECAMKFKSAARYDDLLSIELWLTQLSRLRLNFSYRILNASGAVLLEASTAHICASVAEKPKRISEEFTQFLAPYLNHEISATPGATHVTVV